MACGDTPRAPVEDRYGRSSPSSSSDYRVQRGDTLYSIAFRYGLDYRRLAAANGISSPYTIYVGQPLKLKEATPKPAAKPRPTSSSSSSSTSSSKPKTAPPPASKPAVTQSSSRPATKTTSTKTSTSKSVASGPVKSWRWPSSGKVVRRYSSTVHKGVDIGGKKGDAVVAVAAGQVVYAGTGIVGLGELLIVKHNDVYLSAYGHNNRLLVAEGDSVRAGQKIAEKGSSGTDSVRLHFEIRKSGKPIDPLRLLPRR